MTDLPEYDETISCPDCGDKSSVFMGLHGVFGGGGPGKYTMCTNCGRVLSKTCDSHKEQNDELTEIKTPNVQAPEDNQP